jgi:hypothetical protein
LIGGCDLGRVGRPAADEKRGEGPEQGGHQQESV